MRWFARINWAKLFFKFSGQLAFAHHMLRRLRGAINMHHEKSAIPVLANRWPHDVAIGPRNLARLDFAEWNPLKAALFKFIFRNERRINHASCLEQENQPMHVALIAPLAHHAHATDIVAGKSDARLL